MQADPTCADVFTIRRCRAATANPANILFAAASRRRRRRQEAAAEAQEAEEAQEAAGGGKGAGGGRGAGGARRRPNFGASGAPGAVRGAENAVPGLPQL